MPEVYGYSALHNAVIARDLKAVHTLATTDAGCNIESRDAMGFTALHLATLQGNKDLVEMLVQVGCDVNSSTKVSFLIFTQTRKEAGQVMILVDVPATVGCLVFVVIAVRLTYRLIQTD